MSPDLPEKVLDISLDGPGESESTAPDDGEEEAEEYDRFFFFTIGHQRLAVEVDAVKTVIELPESVTNVPRAPPAIEGVTDIRGEITAIIEPRVHFPTDEEPADDQRLLVLDRPADRQAAAMRIDSVDGVDTIPEEDVLDDEAVESSDFEGQALDHPLVVALIEREHVHVEEDRDPHADSEHSLVDDSSSVLGEPSTEAFVDPFEETEGRSAESAISARKVVVEATPLVDVERLLFASGRRSKAVSVEPT